VDHRQHDLAGSIMIALRHTDVDELNHRARTRMSAAGRLTGPTLVVGGGVELQAGERIVCLRNNRQLGVVNGTRATIVRIHPAARTVEAVDDRGRPLTLPGGYLDAGHVATATPSPATRPKGSPSTTPTRWAPKRCTANGATSRCPAAGSPTSSTTAPPPRRRGAAPPHPHRGPRRRGEPHRPAAPYTCGDAHQPAARRRRGRLAAAHRQLDAIDLPRQQTLLNQRDRLDQDRRMLGERIERLHRQLQQETAGFPWPKRRRLVQDLHTEHDRTATRLEDVTRQLATIDAVIANEGLPDRRELGELFDRLEGLDAQLRREAAVRVRAFRSDPPPYLTAALGPPPADGRKRDRWERTATAIEQHRLRWQITDPTDALGSATDNRRMRHSRAAISDEIRRMLRDAVVGMGGDILAGTVVSRPRVVGAPPRCGGAGVEFAGCHS
jgi:hypothetical protein